jgi:hypothetical protein
MPGIQMCLIMYRNEDEFLRYPGLAPEELESGMACCWSPIEWQELFRLCALFEGLLTPSSWDCGLNYHALPERKHLRQDVD